MALITLDEPLRDQVGRAVYEAPDLNGETPDWYALSEERREEWRKDADRALAVVARQLDELEHSDAAAMLRAAMGAEG